MKNQKNPKRLITSKEIATVFKNLPQNKSLGPYGFTDKFNKTLKDLITILKYFLKAEDEAMLLKPFFKVKVTQISDPGKDNSHTHTHITNQHLS